MRLDPFCFSGMTSANPCGIALDRWGALFIKSNGPRLCFATPGLIPTTHNRELMQYAEVGATAGKSMGVEIVETAAQPDWLQNSALIAGYFARQVSAIPLVEEGSGFQKSESVVLLSSDHPSFRPVDIRMGPDGGIYVADWFNPVINHYQVSLRHPHRDYEHGRIWKISAKNRKPVEAPEFDEQSVDEWLESLRSTERWTRDQARRLLSDQDPEKIGDVLQKWTQQLDPKSKSDSHTLVEAAGVLESLVLITPEVLDQLLASVEPRTRALAGRIIARAAPPFEGAESRLMQLLRDPHPRPRLEGVIACASDSQPAALTAALTVLDSEMDKNIDYALGQTLHARAEEWLPMIELDRVKFFSDRHLAFVLDTYGGEIAAAAARRTLARDSLAVEDRPAFLDILARHGTAEDLRNLVVDEAQAHPELLDTLITAWPGRRIKPAPPYAKELGAFLSGETAPVKIAALRLAGLWRVNELANEIEALALDKQTAPAIRSVALSSYGSLRGKSGAGQLAKVAVEKSTPSVVQNSAVEALAAADIAMAADAVLQLVENSADADDFSPILRPVLSKTTGPAALAKSLESRELAPAKAKKIAGALAGLGRTDGELTGVLNQILGIKDDAPGGAPEDYDAERVARIVAAVTAGKGDAKRGREVYQLAQLNCVACHQINKVGGVIGPSLDTVGAGLPLDQIVDSVLYPARQLKEGYFATAVTTIDGQVHTGYVDPDINNAANIWLRDAATQKLRPVSTHQLKEMKDIGTLMPPGLTASLNQQQLNDLIAYLASLKG
jgi:putative heme-binding domain-containing protein